jgi:hypothetical protein
MLKWGMTDALPVSPAEALALELNAAVAGRKAALELERRFLPEDAKASTNKEQFQVRVIEARLQAAAADPQASVGPLASLAVAEAEALGEEAQAAGTLITPGSRPVGLLRLVAGLLRAARISESKARALLGLARHGRRWEGGVPALQLAAEHELLYMALRRFEGLLQKGGAWDPADVAWLRLRAASLPARLIQVAAELRAAAEAAAQSPLPPALEAARRPFLDQAFSPGEALAWAAAGFSPQEARAWGAGGLPLPAQAALWRARGFDLPRAQAWVQADLLADEAALFQSCGVEDPALAHQLRAALGDVEMLPAWHRAGYAPDEVLTLRTEGCKQPDQAPPPRPKPVAVAPEPPRLVIIHEASKAPGEAPMSPAKAAPTAAAVAAPPPLAAGLDDLLGMGPAAAPPPAPVPPPSQPAIIQGDGLSAAVRTLRPSATWAQKRAQTLLGSDAADDAQAWAAGLPNGAAWLGWGAFEAAALPAGGDERAFVWPQAGGSLLVMGGSEQLAAAGSVHEIRDLRPDPLWQEGLDALRAKRGLAKHAGAWLLQASAPQGGALAWGLVFPAGPPPWAQAVDHQERETWVHRWARKTEEWGEEGKASHAQVGRLADGSWWVALAETLVPSAATPQSMPFGAVRAAWNEALQEFCLKMEMPSQAGHWRLFGQALTVLG